ncbi:MAG TPA: hypothetical protein VNQ90_10925 [Chthoniobacteraceae bacterium]|nr:hypothetical protein [Chthoniobacteraceae bacterium]
MPPSSSSRCTALTQVELLVVMVVGALLVALVYGAGFRAVNHARGTLNTAQHRQITAALLAHAADHRGEFPWCTEDKPGGGSTKVWSRILTAGGYVSDPGIFFSPWGPKWWRTKPLLSVLAKPQNENLNPWYYIGYGVSRNAVMPRRGMDNAKKRPANLSRMAADGVVSRLMILRDVYDSRVPERNGGVAWFSRQVNVPEAVDRNGYELIHASFADGHVEVYTLKQYEALSKTPAVQAPFYDGTYVQ